MPNWEEREETYHPVMEVSRAYGNPVISAASLDMGTPASLQFISRSTNRLHLRANLVNRALLYSLHRVKVVRPTDFLFGVWMPPGIEREAMEALDEYAFYPERYPELVHPSAADMAEEMTADW